MGSKFLGWVGLEWFEKSDPCLTLIHSALGGTVPAPYGKHRKL